MEASLPSNSISPMLDKYDDTTDLDERVDAYVMQVSLYIS